MTPSDKEKTQYPLEEILGESIKSKKGQSLLDFILDGSCKKTFLKGGYEWQTRDVIFCANDKKGIACEIDSESQIIVKIVLQSEDLIDGFRQFSGDLPLGIEFDTSKDETIKKLGKPLYLDNGTDNYAEYKVSNLEYRIIFSENSESIKRIVLNSSLLGEDTP